MSDCDQTVSLEKPKRLSWAERCELSRLAKNDPQPGDRWHEMYSWWMYVVERDGDTVTSLGVGPSREFPHWDNELKIMTVAEFSKYVSYEKIEGTWCDLADRGNDVTDWLKLYAEQLAARVAVALTP